MTNARSDGILSKRSFRGPLDKGRRCVVIADGWDELCFYGNIAYVLFCVRFKPTRSLFHSTEGAAAWSLPMG